MNPVAAVGQLLRDGEANPEFLGSCFAYRSRTHLITAAHCVTGLVAKEILVATTHQRVVLRRGTRLRIHPTADLAIVETESGDDMMEPFLKLPGGHALAQDFYAYGFPEDIFGPDGSRPTPRAFKGHFQRFMRYQSRFGYEYAAGELSIPAPAGLSGGPVFGTDHVAAGYVYGVVTENLESTTVLHSVEEVDNDGSVIKTRYQNVINYGVAVILAEYSDWLDEHIPPVLHT